MNQLCIDHYGWIRAQKFKVNAAPTKPKTIKQQMREPSSKYVSPTATTAPKLDFFATDSGRKMTQPKKAQRSVLVPATSSETKHLSNKDKIRNEFFLNTLGVGDSSYNGSGTKSSRRVKADRVESLQESLMALKVNGSVDGRSQGSFVASENSYAD